MTPIVCSRCNAESQVPFTPTPGRPIFCADCHRKALARAERRAQKPLPPRRRMLSMRRKGHFVHDALEALGGEDSEEGLDEQNRRSFVEMVFARGSRQGSASALEFIQEKTADGTLPPAKADALNGVVRDYSKRQ